MLITCDNSANHIRIVVLGAQQSGKSAITVRFLTKRFISEYSSSKDFLYTHRIQFDGIITDIEVLDTSSCKNAQCLYDHIGWGNAFAIVYSVCDTKSFTQARHLLETISVLKGPHKQPVILLGNKTDMAEFARQVDTNESQEMCSQYKCRLYEVSAAESSLQIMTAFESLIRDLWPQLAFARLPTVKRKNSSGITVSKMIGMVFGKNSRTQKKKSLSI